MNADNKMRIALNWYRIIKYNDSLKFETNEKNHKLYTVNQIHRMPHILTSPSWVQGGVEWISKLPSNLSNDSDFYISTPLVWPHLWITVVLSLENAHLCLRSWCQQIIFSLDLFWVAHDTTKIRLFFRKYSFSKVN